MPVKVALAQLRSVGGDIDKNLEKLSDFTILAAKGGAKLIITPELYLTGYNVKPISKLKDLAITLPDNYESKTYGSNNSILDKIGLIAINNNIDIVIGLPESKDLIYFNTAIWMNNSGIIKHIYRKGHLWGNLEHSVFTQDIKNAISPYKIIKFCGLNFGLLICYDIEFIEPARILALKGCDCILILTALPSNENHILNSIIISRAVENSCHVIYCNFPSPGFSGGTCCVAPNGKKIANAGYLNEALLFATINVKKYAEFKKRNNYLVDRRVELYPEILSKL